MSWGSHISFYLVNPCSSWNLSDIRFWHTHKPLSFSPVSSRLIWCESPWAPLKKLMWHQLYSTVLYSLLWLHRHFFNWNKHLNKFLIQSLHCEGDKLSLNNIVQDFLFFKSTDCKWVSATEDSKNATQFHEQPLLSRIICITALSENVNNHSMLRQHHDKWGNTIALHI